MAKLKTFKYLLTIEVADDIADKYPNYSVNWDTPEEFVEDTVIGMTSAADYDLTQKDSLKDLGYRIRAKEI